MREYHKIQTVFKRDPETNHKALLIGDYALPEFGYLAKNEWVFTEKVDGTNIRVMTADGRINFGGKTDNAQLPAPLVERLGVRFHPQRDRMVEMFPDGACLYGEGYGAKIQKGGGNYRPDQDFVLFDVKIGGWWLERAAVEDIAGKLGLDVVPIIGTGTLDSMVEMTATGFFSEWGEFVAEGIVARPAVELKTRNGQRIITKLKHCDFPANARAVAWPPASKRGHHAIRWHELHTHSRDHPGRPVQPRRPHRLAGDDAGGGDV